MFAIKKTVQHINKSFGGFGKEYGNLLYNFRNEKIYILVKHAKFTRSIIVVELCLNLSIRE